jgi:hypothetical protein
MPSWAAATLTGFDPRHSRAALASRSWVSIQVSDGTVGPARPSTRS